MDFYAKFTELLLQMPHNAVSARMSENVGFSTAVSNSRNIYLSHAIVDSQDCYYSNHLYKARDCTDCTYVSASELCYECLDSSFLYNCAYLQDCHNCSECEFSIDCNNCKYCFGCWGLRHRQFCIFNVQYSEETYREKISILRKNPSLKVLQILEPEFLKHPRLYARLLKGFENCYGDYIYFSKNCFQCFSVRNAENCAYVSEALSTEASTTDCYDCTGINGGSSCYECTTVENCTDCSFADGCVSCSNCEYIRYCHGCQDCFGCVYLSNKQYYILNKPFSRDEYFAAVKLIKNELRQNKEYGKTLAQLLEK